MIKEKESNRNVHIWLLIVFAAAMVVLTIWDIRITAEQQALMPNLSFLVSILSYSAFTCTLFVLFYLFTRQRNRRKMHRIILYGSWVLVIYNGIEILFFREMDGLSNILGVLLGIAIILIVSRRLPDAEEQQQPV